MRKRVVTAMETRRENEKKNLQKGARQGSAEENVSSASIASFLLDWMDLTYQEYDEAAHRVFVFDYLGGHFRLYVSYTTRNYRLMYPDFLCVGVEEETRLIDLCQKLTNVYPYIKATTDHDCLSNECHAYLFQDKCFGEMLDRNRMQLLNGLDKCFHIQSKAQRMLEEARERPLPRYGNVLVHEEKCEKRWAHQHTEEEETSGSGLMDRTQKHLTLVCLLGLLRAGWMGYDAEA